MRIRILSSVVLLLTVALTGCSSGRAKVSGKVYVGNNLVTRGHVQIHAEDGKKVGVGPIQGDGTYTVPDAPTGVCKITIKPAPPMPTAGAPPRGVTPIGQGAISGTTPKALSAHVPDRYQKTEMTDLGVTVQPGDNTYDIRMNP